jgi:hypothetical protein
MGFALQRVIGLRRRRAGLPESKPFMAFGALLKSMSECAVSSVPELVHPGSGPFSLIDRYACTNHPDNRLDGRAVDAQIRKAEKRAISNTENARREALKSCARPPGRRRSAGGRAIPPGHGRQ